MYSDREILYFLQTIPGIGNKTIRQLWHYFPSGDAVFNAVESDLKQILKPSQVRAFLQEREKETPSSKLAELQKKGIRYYSIFDWQYPLRLRTAADPPLSLFVRGELPPEKEMTAAVVGARYHSYYGEKHTRAFSSLLAKQGIGIVSGMAKGIDSIAQLTAIENGGKTYAVLGCGVDVCYPEESRKLYEMIPAHGGIISEYLPETMPQAGLFPMRNRIISALGDILLVMEAKEKSGTLITVDMALEQGKEIWALPGRVDDILSVGCNRLIAQGAGILTDLGEFAKELEWMKEKYGTSRRDIGKKRSKQQKEVEKNESVRDELNCKNPAWNIEKEILSILNYQPSSIDAVYKAICRKKQITLTIPELSMILLELCMQKKIKQVNGGFYVSV